MISTATAINSMIPMTYRTIQILSMDWLRAFRAVVPFSTVWRPTVGTDVIIDVLSVILSYLIGYRHQRDEHECYREQYKYAHVDEAHVST